MWVFNEAINSYSNSYYPENPGEKQRNVAKCTEWRRKICGAQHAAGKKLVNALLTDFTLFLQTYNSSSNTSVWNTDSLLTPSCAQIPFDEDSHSWVRGFSIKCAVLCPPHDSGIHLALVKHWKKKLQKIQNALAFAALLWSKIVFFFFSVMKKFWTIQSIHKHNGYTHFC